MVLTLNFRPGIFLKREMLSVKKPCWLKELIHAFFSPTMNTTELALTLLIRELRLIYNSVLAIVLATWPLISVTWLPSWF